MRASRLVAFALDGALLCVLIAPIVLPFARMKRGTPSMLQRALSPLSQVLRRIAGLPADGGPLPVEHQMSLGRYGLSMGAFLGGGVLLAAPLQRGAPIVRAMVSAVLGLCALLVLSRGLSGNSAGSRAGHRNSAKPVGNFWADAIFGSLYILLPLALTLTLFLTARGPLQDFVYTHVQPVAASLDKVIHAPCK